MLRGLRRAATALPARAQAVAAPHGAVASNTSTAVEAVAFENIEARWPTLSDAARQAHREKLLEVLKGDWKQLTIAQKQAALFVAYGSNKPAPSDLSHVVGGTVAACVVGMGMYMWIRSMGKETPRSMNREWQEKTNEYMRSQNSNPISGISSEGYKGRGYVQV